MLLGATLSCGMPRDPELTLAGIEKGGVLSAGLVREEPALDAAHRWLVEQYAARLGVKVEWTEDAQSELLEALRRHHLHLVVGGLQERHFSGWRVALSVPYLRSRLTLGAPPGVALPTEARGVEAVIDPPSDEVRHWLEEHGGKVTAAGPLIAAEDYRLEARGLSLSEVTLHEEARVVAVAEGENALLRSVDLFIHDHRDRFRATLKENLR